MSGSGAKRPLETTDLTSLEGECTNFGCSQILAGLLCVRLCTIDIRFCPEERKCPRPRAFAHYVPGLDYRATGAGPWSSSGGLDAEAFIGL
jgi:hypothetical protein